MSSVNTPRSSCNLKETYSRVQNGVSKLTLTRRDVVAACTSKSNSQESSTSPIWNEMCWAVQDCEVFTPICCSELGRELENFSINIDLILYIMPRNKPKKNDGMHDHESPRTILQCRWQYSFHCRWTDRTTALLPGTPRPSGAQSTAYSQFNNVASTPYLP